MLANGGKKRLGQLGIRADDEPGIGLQLQHIQQLFGLTLQGDGLQVLVRLQHVVQGHTVSAQGLDRRRTTRHKHRIEGD
ncbi:hypothetical protein D3C81_2237820 [compost metagenome]